MILRRLRFLRRMLFARLRQTDRSCPYCGHEQSILLGRKFAILGMRRCIQCQLQFRYPKDSTQFNAVFYQTRYRQEGLTTDLPTPNQLAQLLQSRFAGNEKDYSRRIGILKTSEPSGRVLDFGCSWGYAVWQLKQAGYDVQGFELSVPRAAYGMQHLAVPILTDYAALDRVAADTYDIIVTSHVLEHLPDLNGVFERFRRLLKPNGFLLIWVPNGSGTAAKRLGAYWGPSISEKHTMVYTTTFFKQALPLHGFAVLKLADSDPQPVTLSPDDPSDPPGDELLVVARLEPHTAAAVS